MTADHAPTEPTAVLLRAGGQLLRAAARSQLTAALFGLVVVVAVLPSVTTGFFTRYNIDSLEATIAVAVVVAFGQVATLAIGQFNLALGAIGGSAGMLMGWLMQTKGFGTLAAVSSACALGVLLGFGQGLMIAKTRINAFVISLGLASVYGGVLLGLTKSNSYSELTNGFVRFGQHDVFGVRILIVPALVVLAMTYILYRLTVSGRRMLAVGVSQKVARMTGIRVGRTVILAHTLSGFLGALAGVMLAAQLDSAQPYGGSDWLLSSFAAPVLGGTLLAGGRVGVLGTLVGVMFLSVVDKALILLGANPYWYQAFLGLLILGAVGLERGRVSLARAWRL